VGARAWLGPLPGGRGACRLHPENNPTLYREAESWVGLLLSEREERDVSRAQESQVRNFLREICDQSSWYFASSAAAWAFSFPCSRP
jgi:hypothetical protein